MNFLILNFLFTEKYFRPFNVEYGFGLTEKLLFVKNELLTIDDV